MRIPHTPAMLYPAGWHPHPSGESRGDGMGFMSLLLSDSLVEHEGLAELGLSEMALVNFEWHSYYDGQVLLLGPLGATIGLNDPAYYRQEWRSRPRIVMWTATLVGELDGQPFAYAGAEPSISLLVDSLLVDAMQSADLKRRRALRQLLRGGALSDLNLE